MKVALATRAIYPYDSGGMERHGAFLANALVDDGIKLDVIAPFSEAGNSSFPVKFNPIHAERPNLQPDLLANYLFSRNVAGIIRQGDYDLAYGEGSALWAYLEEKEIPCISNPHGIEGQKERDPLRRLKLAPQRAAGRYIIRNSDRVISLGGHLTEEIMRYFKIPRERIAVIPNAIDLDYVQQNLPDAREAKEDDRLTLVVVGRLMKYKGQHLVIEALNRLDPKKVRLIVVGDGPDRKKLEGLVEHGNVEFTGQVGGDEVFRYYARADAYVFASYFEGMPTVILEAMASQLLIIASDTGAVPDMVDEKVGFLIKPESKEALHEAMVKTLELPIEERKILGENAYRRVKENFTWPRVAKQTVVLFEELVKSDLG